VRLDEHGRLPAWLFVPGKKMVKVRDKRDKG
jgi:hypothetical protein